MISKEELYFNVPYYARVQVHIFLLLSSRKWLRALMFEKHIILLILSTAAAPLFILRVNDPF